MKRFLTTAAMLVLMPGPSGCGYNELQSADESTSAGWSDVVNQDERRADLSPNLVDTGTRVNRRRKGSCFG